MFICLYTALQVLDAEMQIVDWRIVSHCNIQLNHDDLQPLVALV